MLDCRVPEVRLVEVEPSSTEQALVVHLPSTVFVTPVKETNRFEISTTGGSHIHILPLSKMFLTKGKLLHYGHDILPSNKIICDGSNLYAISFCRVE